MDIPLRGDDGDVYPSWRDLAGEKPTALLDAKSFTPQQQEQLRDELAQVVQAETVRDGDEVAVMWPSPFVIDASTNGHGLSGFEKLRRFAAANLPRLQPQLDQLAIVETEAITTLERVLDAKGSNGEEHDGFARLLGEFERKVDVLAQKAGKPMANLPMLVLWQTVVEQDSRGVWRVVELDTKGGRSGTPLLALRQTDDAGRLSPLWHAVRILESVEEARKAINAKDAQRAMVTGMTIGESRKVLGIKAVRAEHNSDAGDARAKAKAKRDEPRNEWLRGRARFRSQSIYYRNNRGEFWKKLEEELSEKAVKEGWQEIKVGAIKAIIGNPFS